MLTQVWPETLQYVHIFSVPVGRGVSGKRKRLSAFNVLWGMSVKVMENHGQLYRNTFISTCFTHSFHQMMFLYLVFFFKKRNMKSILHPFDLSQGR